MIVNQHDRLFDIRISTKHHFSDSVFMIRSLDNYKFKYDKVATMTKSFTRHLDIDKIILLAGFDNYDMPFLTI